MTLSWTAATVRMVAAGIGIASLAGCGGKLGRAGPTTPSRPLITYLRLPDPYQNPPGVYGDTVAWGGGPEGRGPSRLYISSTTRFRPRLVATGRLGFPGSIQLSKNWLVWVDLTGGQVERWNLWAMSRHSGRTYLIDSSNREGWAPYLSFGPQATLDGDRLAWVYSGCQPVACSYGWKSEVVVMTLPTGSRHVLAQGRFVMGQGASPNPQQQVFFSWPWMSHGVLVWERETPSGTDVLIYRYGREGISVLPSGHRGSLPTTNGRYVAWKAAPHRLIDGAIVLFDLKTGRKQVLMRKSGSTPSMNEDGLIWLGTDPDARSIGVFDFRTQRKYHVWLKNDWMADHLGISATGKLAFEVDGALERNGYEVQRYIGLVTLP
jgi:hypothetical protein